ncbi:MAG: DUF5106 domain-containing protein [Vicingus serpentipes]|nr:DUF5106 domain-containing protein [Vicingus serpentipes]
MKKLLPLLIVSLICLTGFSQKSGYKLKMKINGMQDSTCFLINYFGNQRYYKDTAQFNSSGSIVFEGEEALPEGIYGVFTGGKLLFELIINESYIELETDTLDFVKNLNIKKSEENKLFFEHLFLVNEKQEESKVLRDKLSLNTTSEEEKKEIEDKLAAIGKEINDYRLNVIKDHPNSFNALIYKTMKEPEIPSFSEEKNDSVVRLLKYEYLKKHFFDDVDFSDSRINNTPLYHNKIEKYFTNIVIPTPDSINKEADFVIEKAKAHPDVFKYTVHYLINKYERSKIMGMDAVFSHIALKYYTHDLAFWVDSAQIEKVQERAQKLVPLLIGKTAINLTLLDTSGKNWISMHDLKTDYTVLVFWDPNCGHCKKEMPLLAKYFDSIKDDQSISVYAVSSKGDRQWVRFIMDNNLNFDNVAVPQDVYENQEKATEYILKGYTDLQSLNYHATYDIYSTPQIYLLDKNKKIIAKKLSVDLLEEILDKEFDKKE